MNKRRKTGQAPNWLGVWLLGAVLALLATGCTQPTSTLLTTEDFQYMASESGKELRASLVDGFLAERGPDSPQMVIGMQSVTNYSHDMITDGERWYLMAKLRDTLNHELRREKNIVFVMPADKLREARKLGTIDEGALADRAPTHVMDGRIRSLDRATTTDQASAYLFDCEIKDLRSGAVVWSGQAELKRWARGRQWD